MKLSIHLLTLLASLTTLGANSKVVKPIKKVTDLTVINNAWYTMQAGSAPWGYFHETIEHLSDGRYSYRYSMTKFERGAKLEENIGARAEADLTPIAFNLNKSGVSATETTNGVYSRTPTNGLMTIEVTGARSASFKRYLNKNAIFDVFFPVWLSQNWSKFKAGYKGWVSTFAEDPEHEDFRARTIKFQIKETDLDKGCLNLDVDMESLITKWCVTKEGVLLELKMKGYHVSKVSGEAEAKSFLSGVLPQSKK